MTKVILLLVGIITIITSFWFHPDDPTTKGVVENVDTWLIQVVIGSLLIVISLGIHVGHMGLDIDVDDFDIDFD